MFADNHRRLQYGEHRVHTARVDPSFRPSDAPGAAAFKCLTDGRWMPTKVTLAPTTGATAAATIAVPKVGSATS